MEFLELVEHLTIGKSMTFISESVFEWQRSWMRLFNQWRNCIICSLFLAYTVLQSYLYSTFRIELTQMLQVSTIEYSWLSSIYFYTLALTLIPVGICYDLKPAKTLLRFAALLSAIAAFIFWLSDSFWWHILNRVLCGTANAFAFIGGLRIIAYCNTRYVALATGFLFAIGNLGGLIAAWPYVYFKQKFGWEIVAIINWWLGILVVFICLHYLRNLSVRFQGAQNLRHGFIKTSYAILKNTYLSAKNINHWLLCGLYAGIFVLPDVLFACLWGTTYLVQKYVLSEVQANMVIGSFTVGIAIGGPIMGYLADKFTKIKYFMMIGSTACLLLILVILNITHLSLSVLMTLFGMLGVMACSEIFAFICIQLYSDENSIGVSLALTALIMNLMGATAQPLFGWVLSMQSSEIILDGLSMYSTATLEQAFGLLPLAFLLSIGLAYFIKAKITTERL